ncbi:hypothetical protein FACS1894195_2890 [Bacteroidia bacterium]|nr:hypothetical protein FACS1894195_2890 [Bacteroidia bacterium]
MGADVLYVEKAKLESYFVRRRRRPPCQFTETELLAEAAQAIEDYKVGQVYTTKEMRAIHPLS